MNECKLTHCKAGTCGFISRVDGHSSFATRMRELGLIPGQWVEVVQAGCTYQLIIGDSRYCLRADHLEDVSICPVLEETAVSS